MIGGNISSAPCFVDRKVTEFIDNQLRRALDSDGNSALETAGGLGRWQGVIMSTAVVNSTECPFRAGGWAESDRQNAFCRGRRCDQDDVGLVAMKARRRTGSGLAAVDLFGPVPLEVIEGFEHGEAPRS